MALARLSVAPLTGAPPRMVQFAGPQDGALGERSCAAMKPTLALATDAAAAEVDAGDAGGRRVDAADRDTAQALVVEVPVGQGHDHCGVASRAAVVVNLVDLDGCGRPGRGQPGCGSRPTGLGFRSWRCR